MKRFMHSILMCMLMGSVRGVETSALQHDGADYLIAQILQVWSIINLARSIASYENAKLNDDIFAANLELYGKMYHMLHGQHQCQPADLEPMYAVLAALRQNHDNLCEVQNEFDSTAIRKLMAAIWSISQKFSPESVMQP
jgi:hypothetical protein